MKIKYKVLRYFTIVKNVFFSIHLSMTVFAFLIKSIKLIYMFFRRNYELNVDGSKVIDWMIGKSLYLWEINYKIIYLKRMTL